MKKLTASCSAQKVACWPDFSSLNFLCVHYFATRGTGSSCVFGCGFNRHRECHSKRNSKTQPFESLNILHELFLNDFLWKSVFFQTNIPLQRQCCAGIYSLYLTLEKARAGTSMYNLDEKCGPSLFLC
jgi:hypothetical protein